MPRDKDKLLIEALETDQMLRSEVIAISRGLVGDQSLYLIVNEQDEVIPLSFRSDEKDFMRSRFKQRGLPFQYVTSAPLDFDALDTLVQFLKVVS